VVAIVLAGILKVTRSAGRRYAAACLAMAALLLAFGVSFIHLVLQQRNPGPNTSPIVLDWTSRAVAGLDFGSRAQLRLADFLPWLGPFWMAGVVIFYLKHLASCLGARHLRRVGVCLAANEWQGRLDRMRSHMRVSRPVTLLESCLAEVPVVIGHLRPVILMPVGLVAGLPAGQVEWILLHELAHIRRHDYLINMLETAVEGLLFYHPVAWWISGIIRTEREHCSDDLAVAIGGDAHEYAVALSALAQRRRSAPEVALAAAGGSLVKRIRRLLIPTECPSTGLTPFFSAGIVMITVAAGLTAWQAAQAQVTAVSPYTRWLLQDVVYIISPEERAAFRRLETDAEREQFIQQFWQRRDPTPGTPKNEFQEEHYRRIAYANLHFPTASGIPGWKTDRGRIYIVFGPPDEIDTHGVGDATTRTPYEDWRYRFIEGIGGDVHMQFVDTNGLNDFHMTRDPNPPR
jgi:GWxTD domain-containing protein